MQVNGGNDMKNIIVAIVLSVIAVASFSINFLQFNEKGFLFNNAYLYASKKEKETMDKKPQYKQSGIVFFDDWHYFLA